MIKIINLEEIKKIDFFESIIENIKFDSKSDFSDIIISISLFWKFLDKQNAKVKFMNCSKIILNTKKNNIKKRNDKHICIYEIDEIKINSELSGYNVKIETNYCSDFIQLFCENINVYLE